MSILLMFDAVAAGGGNDGVAAAAAAVSGKYYYSLWLTFGMNVHRRVAIESLYEHYKIETRKVIRFYNKLGWH